MQQKYNVFLLFFPITQRQFSQAVEKLKLQLQVTTIRWNTLKKLTYFTIAFVALCIDCFKILNIQLTHSKAWMSVIKVKHKLNRTSIDVCIMSRISKLSSRLILI